MLPELRADLRQLDEDDVAQLALRVVGDADVHDARLAGRLHVLVVFGIEQVLRNVGHGAPQRVDEGARVSAGAAKSIRAPKWESRNRGPLARLRVRRFGAPPTPSRTRWSSCVSVPSLSMT